MKITYCLIIFNGDYVLQQLLQTIYPFAHRIIIVDGVVDYWAQRGFSGSVDDTISIIENFPDPAKKIILHKNIVRKEKTELCQVYMADVPDDTDYLWCCDSDEIFKPQDIFTVNHILDAYEPASVSFRSTTFFGGFSHILGGFERAVGFKRILKYSPGATYTEHRPPTLSSEDYPHALHITSDQMADNWRVEMYHYSYCFPKQVFDKISYYKAAVSKDNCIDDYFYQVWYPWVMYPQWRKELEARFDGAHEFKPQYRGPCFTMDFDGHHPPAIQAVMPQLLEKFEKQLRDYAGS